MNTFYLYQLCYFQCLDLFIIKDKKGEKPRCIIERKEKESDFLKNF